MGAADGYEDDYRDQPAEDPDSQVPVRLQAQAQLTFGRSYHVEPVTRRTVWTVQDLNL